MIEIRNVSLSLRGSAILHDITAGLPQTGITALIGPNGAGKSSLLHLCAGLLRPSGGVIAVDGGDVTRMAHRDRARRIAVLTQAQALGSRLTVGDLVGFGRWPHHLGRPREADRQVVAEALALFDLETLSGRQVETLSGGQKARAFTAMAWAQSTPWLLLDEPLAALDPRFARDLMARLHAMSQTGPQARGVVIVVHDLNAAALWADHVVALRDGRLFADGPAAEVLTPATLGALFDTAFGTVDTPRGRLVYPA
ncbi:ATP-binding cassette domain-containing protein [Pseudoponticoccus marisrubri]|uniref:ABC transporter ATP-binding protein n=1 Tax=Pseudoponticoccus marisrubri TaxID=1685382 RepID=A0A0W7WKK3_9RHOB|nr:ATP-binding cassette domain-containing protein [Pseudoponticoccus marisrubri]KUF11082.1 ABC transporter ATP-binding protein [Pseudoponticoccus marisrubri]